MKEIKIYHNPRCSKSREALKYLNDKGLNLDIILYTKNTLSKYEIKQLILKLKIPAIKLLREKETIFEENKSLINLENEDSIIDLLVEYPSLIQRPIIEINQEAVIGRPFECIVDFLKSKMI